MKTFRPVVALTAAAAVGFGGLAAASPALAAEEVVAQDAFVINEVNSTGDAPDSIEILNTAAVEVSLDGVIVMDSKDEAAATVADWGMVPAGGYAVLENDVDFTFGLGKGDSVRLFAPGTELTTDGGLVDPATEPFDATTWPVDTHAEPSWGRCPDGTGEFAITASLTLGAANDCLPVVAPTVETHLVINETQSSAPDDQLGGADWVELKNTATAPLDVNGVIVVDNKNEDEYTITGQDLIPAGGYLVLTEYDAEDFPEGHLDFGLGKGDSVRLFSPGTTELASATPFDATTWTADQHTIASWGRCPDGTGDFRMTATATPGATNDCSGDVEEPVVEPDEVSGDLTINEVESNGDDTDWVEVMNLTESDIDISGWAIKDDDNTRSDVVPAGSVVPAGGLLVIDQESATYPEGFTFGLGNNDMFRLYDEAGELAAKTTWGAHARVSWARCPDGTGDWRDATTSTKGDPNDCSVPVRINEVESSGDDTVLDGQDWVEFINVSGEPVNLGGFTFKDDDDTHAYTFAPDTTLAGGALLVLTEDEFGFGIGKDDTARLFDTADALVDSFTQPAHAGVTWGRCPDGTGDFADTATPTPGELNHCTGLVYPSAWPGGNSVTVLDGENWFSGDLSGIDFESAADGGPGTLWAVENGNGLLFKLTADAAGEWTRAAGWENGRVLRYPDGTGTVDAEGVTVVEADPGAVYVSSERNNDASGVSRPSVLRYDVTGSGELIATDEWNLAADFPGLPANSGLEGITWIPAAALAAGGFEADGTGAFVIGVEGTQEAYLYSLKTGAAGTRLATIDTTAITFNLVADVQWDGDRGVLWVVCDETCDGRIATYTLDNGSFVPTALYERPAGMGNFANEGFAIGDMTVCVDGAVPTFYVDDNDTDGFSLRSGSLSADCGTESDDGDSGDGSSEDEDSNNGDSDKDVPAKDDEPANAGDPSNQVDLCAVSAPASAAAGQGTTVALNADCAPAQVRVVMYSEPTVLGVFNVAADGTVVFTIPADLAVGEHTIEIQALDGTVLGSTPITVTAAVAAVPVADDPSGADELAVTGAGDFDGLLLAAALLASAGGALVVARRAMASPIAVKG